MRILKYTLVLVLLGYTAGVRPSPEARSQTDPPDHGAWDDLVSRHVYPDGTLNYNGFARERDKMEAYIGMLEATPPAEDWSREEKLAYYINLYNAATVRLILDNFPVESILRIRNPWGRNILEIGGEEFNLNNIEHDILREMDEPRIHFAINCASVSCPVLQPFAFTADTIDAQLDAAAREFINDPARNSIGPGQVGLSRIFKWYKEDFTRNGTLLDYINQYLEEPVPAGTGVDFLPYDWNLNRP